MLVDEPRVARDSRDPILMMIGENVAVRPVIVGVYEIGHFGSSAFLEGYEHYPDLSNEHRHCGAYGVCDDISNLLEHCPLLVESPRQFVVTLKRVQRNLSNKGRGGGWRWHKWGEYIGKQTPTTEYLDDEPDIEQVFCYHIYERKA